jgi:DNA-binding CsgD family transcriptional regulator
MQKFIEKDFPKLLDALYDAGLDPERWPDFFGLLSTCFSGAKGVLQFYDRRSNATPTNIVFGSDAEFLRSFAAHYVKFNPYPLATYGAMPVGEVIRASRVVDGPTLLRTEFYNDWMRPQAVCAHHFGVVLQQNDRGMVLLGIAPNASALRKNSERYHRQLQLLAPHLSRAVEMNHLTAKAQFASRAAADALNSLAVPAFVLDRNHRIALANAPAEKLMRAGDLLVLDNYGAMHAARAEDERSFAAALNESSRPQLAISLRLVSRTSGQVFSASVVRGPRTDDRCVRSDVFETIGAANGTLLLVTPAETAVVIRPEVIAEAFGLSAAEARLVTALIAGRTLAEYAESQEVSRNTARNQLASVFEKTGTHRQAELVVHVNRTLVVAGYGHNAKDRKA